VGKRAEVGIQGGGGGGGGVSSHARWVLNILIKTKNFTIFS